MFAMPDFSAMPKQTKVILIISVFAIFAGFAIYAILWLSGQENEKEMFE